MSGRDDLPVDRYTGPTYHELPQVKSSSYGALVWSYTWLGGLAGSAQVIATLADLLGRPSLRGLVHQGRALAAYLPLLGAGLLIADLHTPQRFYNMFRIYRGTSPMSIGTYVLAAFAGSSIATAIAGATGHRKLATAVQLPAAAAGAGMSVYTGALLGATSTPLWSAQPRLLAGRFAASAFASGAAALAIGETLRGHPQQAARLQRVALAAQLAEYGLARASERACRRRGVASALDDPDIAARNRASTQLGVMLPLACAALDHFAARRSRTLSLAGAVGVLAGGLLMRAAVISAGNRSAQRPRDAFANASAQQLGEKPRFKELQP
jgi:protein NrfD